MDIKLRIHTGGYRPATAGLPVATIIRDRRGFFVSSPLLDYERSHSRKPGIYVPARDIHIPNAIPIVDSGAILFRIEPLWFLAEPYVLFRFDITDPRQPKRKWYDARTIPWHVLADMLRNNLISSPEDAEVQQYVLQERQKRIMVGQHKIERREA
jgi:hypothetical protein